MFRITRTAISRVRTSSSAACQRLPMTSSAVVIDYGLARKLPKKEKLALKECQSKEGNGTLEFMSTDAMAGLFSSYRGDLEMLSQRNAHKVTQTAG